MATTYFGISVDLSHLLPTGGVGEAAFPVLAHTVETVVLRAEEQWKRYASGEALPSGRSIGIRSGQYLRSILHRMNGAYAGEVYSNLAYADAIERGTPARDMRDLLNSSLKVRISKKGKRYLIIPFRHDTGKAMSGGNPMPDALREWWRDKDASFVLSVHERPVHSDLLGRMPAPMHRVYSVANHTRSDRILTVAARYYWWGTRLTKGDIERIRRGATPFVALAGEGGRRAEGMVNFRQPGKTGGAAHSQYITFRTLSENSKPGSWMQRAREGYWPARTTANLIRPIAESLFSRAVEEDLKAIMPT